MRYIVRLKDNTTFLGNTGIWDSMNTKPGWIRLSNVEGTSAPVAKKGGKVYVPRESILYMAEDK